MAGPWEKYSGSGPSITDLVTGGSKPWEKYGKPKQTMGTGEDMARSGVSGVGEGTIGMIGTPGDIQSALSSGAGWLSEKTGIGDPEFMRQSMRLAGGSYYPSSQEIKGFAEGAGVQFHEPQTTAGEYARTVGQFVPGMALGPGSATRNIVSGVGSALASEAAGQLTEGSSYEPYARLGGALVGGGVTALKQPGKAPLPSTQQLKNEAQAAYDSAKGAGITVSPQQYQAIVDHVGDIAVNAGANKRLTPMARAALKELVSNEGRPMTIQDLDLMRRNLKMAAGSSNPGERALAQQMVQAFDDAISGVAPPVLKEARRKWATFKKAELLDEIDRSAELRAGQYTQSGTENARRTEFRQLARNQNKMRGFNAKETEAIRKIATGSPAENAARWAGRFAPAGPVSAIPSILAGIGGGGFVGGVPGALIGGGIGAAGLAGKTAATRMSGNNLRQLNELVRTGQTMPETAQRLEAVLRALIQAKESQAPR